MLTTRKNRLDPSQLDPKELKDLVALLSSTGQPALIDEAGNRLNLPKPVYSQLLRVLKMMQEGRAIVMMPEEETFTTQAAANYLGVSRQHLVDLLEKGEILFHKVGSHRRVYFKDLLDYDDRRNTTRHQALDRLAKEVVDAGLYDSTYLGDD
jgi:excisionase family DNA binding protein